MFAQFVENFVQLERSKHILDEHTCLDTADGKTQLHHTAGGITVA